MVFLTGAGFFRLTAILAWSARYMSKAESSAMVTFRGSFFSDFCGMRVPNGVICPVRMSSSHSVSWDGMSMLPSVDGPGSGGK